MNRFHSLALVGALLATGCVSKITGNQGNLEFSYPADDNIADFNKPIAVGAKLEITVAEVGTEKTVELQTATSDDDKVLKVDNFASNKLVVQGIGSGSALLSVTAKMPDGSVKPDSVNMMARVPEVLTLGHTCTTDREALYLVNADVLVPFEMKMKNNQPVIGYGYHPIDIAPAAGAALDQTTKDQVFFHLHTAAAKGTVTLTSKIDSTSATMTLVTEADFDGAKLGPGPTLAIKVGQNGLYHVLPTVQGKPVCQAVSPRTFSVQSPDICEVAPVSNNNGSPAKNEFGWFTVKSKAVGKCNFTVALPNGNGGAGVSVPLSVDITQ